MDIAAFAKVAGGGLLRLVPASYDYASLLSAHIADESARCSLTWVIESIEPHGRFDVQDSTYPTTLTATQLTPVNHTTIVTGADSKYARTIHLC